MHSTTSRGLAQKRADRSRYHSPVQIKKRKLAPLMIVIALSAAMVPTHFMQAYSARLLRYPYLTDVVGNHAIVNWATDSSMQTAHVTWGRSGAEPCTAHSAAAAATR